MMQALPSVTMFTRSHVGRVVRRCVSTGAGRFPVVDMASPRTEQVATVRAACEDLGFFSLINSGIAEGEVEEARSVARHFFALSREEKAAFPLTFEGGELFGWADVGAESADVANVSIIEDEVKDLMESWQTAPPDLHRNEYPFEEMRHILEPLYAKKRQVAHHLLELLAESLGMPADYFRPLHTGGMHRSVMRLTRYPALKEVTSARGAGVSRISPHQDIGSITLLSQDDKGGLEVQDKSTGEWLPVTPVPNSMVINVGNLLMRWSNYRYRSSIHRVVSTASSDAEDRFSVILFVNPRDDAVVQPLPTTVSMYNPAKYEPFTVDEYLSCKFTQLFDPDARDEKGACRFDD